MEHPHPPAPVLLCFHGRETRPAQSASPIKGEGGQETTLNNPVYLQGDSRGSL
jgi:hypothetical protein